MAERIEMGYMSEAVMVGDKEIIATTPVVIRMYPDECVVTVILGKFDGLMFILTEEQVDRCVVIM